MLATGAKVVLREGRFDPVDVMRLIEQEHVTSWPTTPTMAHRVVHHPELDELYDLEADPFEMENLVDDPTASELRAELREELGRLVLEAMSLGPEG